MTQTVGFIGLGHMGLPMARNLLKAGHAVQGFDISEGARGAAAKAGIAVAGSLVGAVRGAGTVITMLISGDVVRQVHAEVAAAAKPGALVVDCSTIDVESARHVHAELRQRGFRTVDAPVSGGVAAAEAASLTFICGGKPDDVEAARPVLEKMGKRIVACGPAGSGQAAKICNNMILGVSMIAVCEAFTLADRLGLDRQAMFDVVSNASGSCWSINAYCPVPGVGPKSPADNNYEPGFAASLMLKDLKLSQDAAANAGAATPLGAHAAAIYDRFVAEGGGGRDFSAIIQALGAMQREQAP
jgi:3-hydroxyisobutyrate dehydrogenase